MRISYILNNQTYSYEQNDLVELSKLNFLLTNEKGDFLNLGVKNNNCKFQGLNIFNSEQKEIFKFIEEIIPVKLRTFEVINEGYRITRIFNSKFMKPTKIIVSDSNKQDSLFGEEGKLEYDENGNILEKLDVKSPKIPKDHFYVGPSGGMIYEIENFSGNLLIDIDMKKRDDYSTIGRIYNVYKKDNVIMIEYTKNKENNTEIDYKQYLGIKSTNFEYEFIKEWTEKNYEYSKVRNSLSSWYIYRLMKIKIRENKRLIFGTGFTEEEVLKQISLLEQHETELESYGLETYKNNTYLNEHRFENPLTQDVSVAYRLSKFSMLDVFMNSKIEDPKFENSIFAGYPWFSDIWSRDELISLRSLINLGEYDLVKEKLFNYLEQIDDETGCIEILQTKKSNKSCDAVFWLAKRFEDLISKVDEEGEFSKYFFDKELKQIYEKLSQSFNKILKQNWDFDLELLKVKYADSWMDTISVKYPLDIQVGLLEFVSFMAIISNLSGKKDEAEKYLDFEFGLRNKIRTTYLKDNKLYNDIDLNEDNHNCNVFLAYYIYPDLFSQEEWEKIIDNSLKALETNWGGISSLSKFSSNFKSDYTGENNLSYHRGDVWFWINNLSAIVMHDLNEKKYRSQISKILRSSTNDILKMGTVGLGSEISSASSQRAEGSLAQAWSNSTYIEMIDKLFQKK